MPCFEMNLVDILSFTFFVSVEEINSLILGFFLEQNPRPGKFRNCRMVVLGKVIFCQENDYKGGLKWPSMNEFGFIIPFF